MAQQNVNEVILRSIPMNKQMKRFFIRKFQRMVQNNGQAYACDRFKVLRETLIGFRSDHNRSQHVEAWLKNSGFKRTGWLRMLFHYMECQPENALQFVKLYCGPNDPIVTVGEAAEAQHQSLGQAASVKDTTPAFMEKWLHHIGRERKLTPEQYQQLKNYWCTGKWCGPRSIRIWTNGPGGYGWSTYLADPYGISQLEWMKKFICMHSYSEYVDYINKWKRVLWVSPVTDDEVNSQMGSVVPRADMYVDYGHGMRRIGQVSDHGDPLSSESFAKDLDNFLSMQAYLDTPYNMGGNGLTNADYDYMISLLPEEMSLAYLDPDFVVPGIKRDILDGTYVGQIHHIPKKGTVKRRSIAAPNRFVQMGMKPVDIQLSTMLHRLGRVRDCTYNQSAQDLYIGSRVNNENLFSGSVDLHQATDFLPFKWMISIWNNLFEGRVSRMVEQSWILFTHASKGAWLNEGYRDRWVTGQPLGALPSFRCLGLTHNLLLASMSFTLGLVQDPYTVLGDDVVIMNRKLRAFYIRLMTNAGVPLSLNKSYKGDGVEFAGKLFFSNCSPFYNTDQRAITWNSFFDYQFATGIYIPFSNLPRRLRERFANRVQREGVPKDMSNSVYELIVSAMMPARGSHVYQTGKSIDADLISRFIVGLEDSDEKVQAERCSGLTLLPGGHPVTFGRREYADKDGYFQSYRKIDSWYRDKYRPVSTDKLIAVACNALSSGMDSKA